MGIGTAVLSRLAMTQRSFAWERYRYRSATSLDVISSLFEPFSAAGDVAGYFNK